MGIPPAPNSADNTTLGVRISVNNNNDTTDNERVGVNLFPSGQDFSGNFALRLDMWINYNGPAGGGSGSTEHALFGVSQSGEQVSWLASIPDATGDGVWFGVDGEGGAGATGSSSDYYSFLADDFGPLALPAELAGLVSKDEKAPAYQFLFLAPTFETQGAPGKHWVEVEIRIKDGILSWVMNGMVIATREAPDGSLGGRTNGTVMIGYMDTFNSIANPTADNFVIYDNVRVVSLDNDPGLPQLHVDAIDDAAFEPGDDGAEFTIFRAGNASEAVTINVVVGGTARAIVTLVDRRARRAFHRGDRCQCGSRRWRFRYHRPDTGGRSAILSNSILTPRLSR